MFIFFYMKIIIHNRYCQHSTPRAFPEVSEDSPRSICWLPISAYRFLRQIRRSGIPISFKSFPQFVVVHSVKGCNVISEVEIDGFLKFPSFSCDPTDVGNLIFGSSAFSQPSLCIWNSVRVLLKPCLKEVEPLPC